MFVLTNMSQKINPKTTPWGTLLVTYVYPNTLFFRITHYHHPFSPFPIYFTILLVIPYYFSFK